MGKRYVDETGAEVLVTKAGAGTLSHRHNRADISRKPSRCRPATDTFGHVRPRSLLVRYAAGLAFAYLLTAAEVVAIVVSVSGEAVIGAQAVLSAKNLIATVAVVVIGTITVSVSGVALVARALQRADPGRERTAPQPRKAPNITRRQSAILLTPWAIAAVVLIPLNLTTVSASQSLLISAMMFGATATVCTGFLFTQRAIALADGRRHNGFANMPSGRREYGRG